LYIKVRDILQETYTELRAEHIGVSVEEFIKIASNRKDSTNQVLYDKAREAYPIMISDAEPTSVSE
jgi:hypothetical protein